MRCDAARTRLLEVDDPRSGLPLELTAHLAGCPDCRRAADRISSGLTGLAQTLEQTEPPFDEAEAIVWARGAGPGRSAGRRQRRPNRWPSGLGWGTLSTTAVAVIVAVWISGRSTAPTTKWSPTDALADAEPVLSVEVPEGARVAVFHTQNPKIAVVWLY